MAGYRDSSSFDPYASPRYGRPLRPYNWVQWTGVGFILVGVAIDVIYFAARLGWMSKEVAPLIALPPIMAGTLLVNSRREPVQDPAPELAADRRKWMIITVAVVSIILAAATIIDILTGR